MNLNTLIAIIVVSFFGVVALKMTLRKTDHERRMELIEEKERLVNLLNEQEIHKHIFETERMIREVDSLYQYSR